MLLFQKKKRGDLTYVLGISLLRDREARTIQLGQELYVNTVCARFSSYLDKTNMRSFDVPASPELAKFSPAGQIARWRGLSSS